MKREVDYLGSLAEVAGMAHEMAEKLHGFLLHFRASELDMAASRLHELEQRADGKRHDLMKALMSAFVTPVDRGDLIKASQALDNVLDAMEAVMTQLCAAQVRQLRPDALRFSELITRCVGAAVMLMEALRAFPKTGSISGLVVRINQLEEEGDRLYMAAMRSLHAVSTDPVEVMVWRGLYGAFENVCNQCEGLADLVEGVVIGNL